MAKAGIEAREVWLFRSGARRDNHPSSDWNLLVVLDDNAPVTYQDTATLHQLGRNSGLAADVVSVRASEDWAARKLLTILVYVVSRQGIEVTSEE